MTEDNEFCPIQILDVTTLCYCSYCFKATEKYRWKGHTVGNTVHTNTDTCAVGVAIESSQDYWPVSWNRVKCVDFRFNRCHYRGCRLASEKMCVVARHIAAKHTNKIHVEQDFANTSVQVQLNQDQNVAEPSSATGIVEGNQAVVEAEHCSSEDREQKSVEESNEQTASTSQQMVVKSKPLEELESIEAVSGNSCVANESSETSAAVSDTSHFPLDTLEDTDITGDDNQHKCDEPEHTNLQVATTVLPQPSVTLKLQIKKENIEEIKSETYTPGEDIKHDPTCPEEGKLRKSSQFRCGFCHFQTIHILAIKKHYLHNHKTTIVFICEPCYFVSHNKYSFLSHWQAHHPKDDNPPKPVNISLEIEALQDESDDRSADSSKTVNSDQDLGLVTHNVENYNTYLRSKYKTTMIMKCGFCSFETIHLSAIKSHTALHHYTAVSETIVSMPDNTKTYRCVTCSAINQSPKTAAFHYIVQHTKVPASRCDLCEIDLRDYTGLYSHMKSESHQEYYRRSLRCPNCQFVSLSKKALQKHTTAVHKAPPVGKFLCGKCKYVTDSMSQLTAHTKNVHCTYKGEDGLYHCKECDFETRNKATMFYHSKSAPDHISAKSCVRCDICDFAAANEGGLAYHKKLIHGPSSSAKLIND